MALAEAPVPRMHVTERLLSLRRAQPAPPLPTRGVLPAKRRETAWVLVAGGQQGRCRALPQAHLLAPAAHGAAAAVIVGALCSVTRPPSLDQPTGSALNLRTLWLGQVSEAWRNGTLVEMSL